MPYYEYHCASNGQTLEVRHGMNETIDTWADLAERAGADPASAPAQAPVERLMSSPVPTPGSGPAAAPQGCGVGCGCVRG